jgi:putative Holliday junction resolvase
MRCAEDAATLIASPAGRSEGTVLAFDFGTRRIGVATGESITRLAHPLTTIEAEANAMRFAEIEKLLAEWRPVLLVVGLPQALDGSAHEMTMRCRRFGNQLSGRFRLPVLFIDERFTSAEAEGILRSSSRSTRGGHRTIDAVAAQVILQSYFDSGEASAIAA